MGRKCGVPDCDSESGRPEDYGVTFHKVPLHSEFRPKWLSLCRLTEEKGSLKTIYICSRHFLKADFCEFKGKKYMLKQGVFPSVFPWCNLRVKSEVDSKKPENLVSDDIETMSIKIKEVKEDPTEVKPIQRVAEENPEIKSETSSATKTDSAVIDNIEMKEEVLSPTQSTTIEQKIKTIETPTGLLTFAPNTRIEALDFNQSWCPAKIVEVDYQENEVLVHFEKYSSKYDEWICMNSNALRAYKESPIIAPEEKKSVVETFSIGERCMASWSDSRKFPATINKVLDKDLYEVLFDDGFVKVMRGHRISKAQSKSMQSSPLFDPVKGSKQERRDRKRKLNISALFKKRQRASSQEKGDSHSNDSAETVENWTPKWDKGRPVGTESQIETFDGTRKSVIVDDPRLPLNWQKHLTQRVFGASAGKWDTIIVSPDGKRFRSRSEMKQYLDENPHLNLSESMFDFTIHKKVKRGEGSKRSQLVPETISSTLESLTEQQAQEEVESSNSLKIPVVDSGYKCPIDGCGKHFRRENLAQMHVKHYHPEYTKFLDSTPNVADLAYARTVGESLDKSPGLEKVTRAGSSKPTQKTSTPKIATGVKYLSSAVEGEQNQIQMQPKKDSEIIKLLNSRPFDSIKKDEASEMPVLPSGLPPSMYPDIKLKDLLNKSEGIPKRDDINLRTLSAIRPAGSGIKTMLPVVRTNELKSENSETPKQGKQNLKRKRILSETAEFTKKEQIDHNEIQPQNNIIIEGGEVIKIVKMKREEIINCICGMTEEDGLMIQCELCLCWQHAYCNNIERENQVPEKYICYICQNPIRQRSSRKYFHDQDWLKQGVLPVGSYHCKDNDILNKRFEKLKTSHDFSGGLLELKSFLHTLRMKIKIAEAKNHPKLYLWSKPWDKPNLPEKEEIKDLKCEDNKNEEQSDSVLFSLLKSEKDNKLKEELPEFPKIDINSLIENNLDQIPAGPKIPEPEAAIEPETCRINLLDHIMHYQSLVEQRLADFEEKINGLDCGPLLDEDVENYPRVRHTAEMIIRDMNTLNEFAHLTSF